jgi:hypothetical protein
MKRFNLNCNIKVKLKPEGVDIYYHQYDHLLEKGLINERSMPRIDEDGYTEFQAWKFMELYGDKAVGMCPPYHMEILIDEEVLT